MIQKRKSREISLGKMVALPLTNLKLSLNVLPIRKKWKDYSTRLPAPPNLYNRVRPSFLVAQFSGL